MDSPPKLAGETLIVHHIPLVHCQVSSSRQCCGSPLKRNSNPFSCPENLGLIRTTSLPERDILQREALVYSSLIQTSSCSLSSSDTFGDGGMRGGVKRGRGGREGSMASDTSSFTSSNSEDQAQGLPMKTRERPNSRRNPFLLNTEDEDDEDEDNLNGYLEDSSFHLHGNLHEISNSVLANEDLPPFHLHDLGFTAEPFLLHGSTEKQWCSTNGPSGEAESRDHTIGGTFDLSTHMEGLNLLRLDSQRRHGSSGSTLSMDCGDQEWGEDDDYEDQSMQGGRGSSECSSLAAPHCSCCNLSQPYPEHFQESFSECHQGYGSDSSCNSSDGVLVNFSTIYNKMNNVVPAKPLLNINSSDEQSCGSSVSELIGMCGTECSSGRGAFYLDLHTSPIEPPQHPSATQEHANSSSVSQPQGATIEVDANCNSYHNLLGSEGLSSDETSANDLTSCLQSQARLVVATQNYYKLVTCDLSSQSSPSPVGSSVTSCSDEHSKGSPTQPTEYYLFQQMKEDEEEEYAELNAEKDPTEIDSTHENVIEGQVYINISPPMTACNSVGASGSGRPRSRSYDRNLDKSPSPRLGSLERMLSCPVRLSESAAPSPPPPPRVTSFAEIARNKRRTGGSPSQRGGIEATSTHSHSSGEFSPILEGLPQGQSHSLPPLTRCHSQGSCEQTRTKAEGGLSSSTDSSPVVIRYSKDQRPTSLPIQPFTFQHQFGKPQAKPILPLLDGYISHMQARGATVPEGGEDESEEDHRPSHDISTAPTTVRPSPLGSYSPVRIQGAPTSSGTCSTCTPTPGGPRPPRSLSCPISAGLLPQHTPPGVAIRTETPKLAPLPPTPPPPPLMKQSPLMPALPTRSHCFHRGNLPTLPSSGLSPLGQLEPAPQEEPVKVLPVCVTQRQPNVHHLSPQALKWREYRRKNPLGVERGKDGHHSFSCALETKRTGTRVMRRNVFDFPSTNQPLSFGRLNGQSLRQLPQCYSDFLPDYFSQTERPPEEFCLSPDANTDESISIDLLQKRGLVKAINTAVDLIVAHFGTSRDAGVKAKLGNSSVSPNVGHLILKYLCPAIREILHDGLKAYVLDLIIGQRKNQPWSVVEASTQLGPSTRVLHSLFSKVSQYSELTNHSMRLNAFIFGLLNLRSLEFWFNHIYTHEDIIAAHYHPWGFLPLSQGACQPLFEELLLLLQPLSLLPFDLDLLFEPHQLQKGEEHLRRKEQLCSARQGLDQSDRSTFQLMRGCGMLESGAQEVGMLPQREKFMLRDEDSRFRMEGVTLKTKRDGRKSAGAERESRNKEAGVGKECLRKIDAGQIEGGGWCAGRMKGVGEDCEKEKRREREGDGAKQRNRQAGWWYQLMQSSQVYIDNSAEGSKFVKWEKRRKEGIESYRQSHPPPREGVVEGAEAIQQMDEQVEHSRTSSSNNNSVGNGVLHQSALSEPTKAAKGKPSWMGSPPESVLTELKKSKEKQLECQDAYEGVQAQAGAGEVLRWGRLFGAGNSSKMEKSEQKSVRKQRLPSGWLSLDRSVLDLVAQSVGVGKKAEQQSLTSQSQESHLGPTEQAQIQKPPTQRQAPREVKALCHHIATEPGQLSFHKGDVLQVLSRADSDWLLCALGDSQGLVPIIYVTLIEDSQER
ncbi:AP-4 complex accessory subunit RUSC2 isoform X1 [Megalobrama amblycephala]|uniref:AP-4 complex accessory subunit RUSC2 isoform X1 n=1 Tax=Megalobrama amblycephala TaxID=75352 RepID=UPI002013ECB5|nr:AP-4 complex accessory subunit RUSC2 isoform X1 [Megalobrama amblycephala]XP_048044601.1 AP-4 complex accessory subunit RUSC2 isoform X1 [Megalobrama amblycephala]